MEVYFMDYLFTKYDSYGYFEVRKNLVKNDINNLDKKALENSEDSLSLILFHKWKIEPFKTEDYYQSDGGEVDIDLSQNPKYFASHTGKRIIKKGKRIKIHIPFSGGTLDLFSVMPSSYTTVYPKGKVLENEVILNFDFLSESESSEELLKRIKYDEELVLKYLNWLNKDISQYNEQIQNLISSEIQTRKSKLEKDDEIINSLGIPSKKKEDANPIGFVNPIEKFNIEILNEDSPSKDPILYESTYDKITRTINSILINIERCSKPIKDLKEESLRDMIVTALNASASFNGLVSSEAFNRSGKTDILIRYKDKNLYISECKIWKGEIYFIEGITQLLDNLTWRDSKCSYIIFSRNSDFQDVLEKSKEYIENHSNYISFEKDVSESSFKYKFLSSHGSKKEVFLTLHLANISH